MTYKIRVTFYALKSGIEVNHVSGTTMINDASQVKEKLIEFACKYHDEASDLTPLLEQDEEQKGFGVMVAQSNIDPEYHFIFIASRIV